MQFTPSGIISLTTVFEPAEGAGARIAPATYAEDKAKGHAAGPAWSVNGPNIEIDSAGEISTIPGHSPSVIIESVASQATRSENLLWQLRDEFSLPGVVLEAGDEDFLKKTFKANSDIKKLGLPEEQLESLLESFLQRLKTSDQQTSSWTLAHRHIDGFLRYASSTPDGLKELWSKDAVKREMLQSASPEQLSTLMKIAPNSALFGFWLSSGAPINHKVSRSYRSDITGYGASQVHYGATKVSNLPTASDMKFVEDKAGVLTEATKGGVKASESLLGQVISFSDASVTADLILGRASLYNGHLMSVLSKDSSVTQEQREAAFQALCHLGILGHLLREEEWFIRSNCVLVPEKRFWVERTAGNKTSLEIPSIAEFIPETKKAIERAQELEIMGTAEDRMSVYLSKSLLNVALPAFAKANKNALSGAE